MGRKSLIVMFIFQASFALAYHPGTTGATGNVVAKSVSSGSIYGMLIGMFLVVVFLGWFIYSVGKQNTKKK